jgi:hypothetical protein
LTSASNGSSIEHAEHVDVGVEPSPPAPSTPNGSSTPDRRRLVDADAGLADQGEGARRAAAAVSVSPTVAIDHQAVDGPDSLDELDELDDVTAARLDRALARFAQRVEAERLRGAVGVELAALRTRRYGRFSTARLRRYLEVGDVTDVVDHPYDHLGRRELPARVDRLTTAQGEVESLLETAGQHQAEAAVARQIAVEHEPRLPDLYRRENERRRLVGQAQARAAALVRQLYHA